MYVKLTKKPSLKRLLANCNYLGQRFGRLSPLSELLWLPFIINNIFRHCKAKSDVKTQMS